MVDGQPLTFEVFGLLKGVLTMIDRQTDTVWTHLEGKAIRGPLAGKRMATIIAPHVTWAEWKTAHPTTVVLSPDTPLKDRYRSVRIGVFNRREATFGDDRLDANALVVGVEVAEQFKGYPLEQIDLAGGVVNDTLASQPILVIYDAAAQTGLAFSRDINGELLEFYNSAPQGFELRDRKTDSL